MRNTEFKQSLMITHVEDTHFAPLQANNGAPRPMFLYRQLGVDKATGGAYDAHVIRAAPGGTPPIGEHKHTELDVLFVYVLNGWVRFGYVGHGEHTLKAGDCHVIPPGLSHSVIDWSPDVELLEITSPAEYKTIDTVNGIE